MTDKTRPKVLKTWHVEGVDGYLSISETVEGDQLALAIGEGATIKATLRFDYAAWAALGELAYGPDKSWYDGPAITVPEEEVAA